MSNRTKKDGERYMPLEIAHAISSAVAELIKFNRNTPIMSTLMIPKATFCVECDLETLGQAVQRLTKFGYKVATSPGTTSHVIHIEDIRC